MKKVTILGSTGSIGAQTLEVIANNSDKLCVHALVAFSNSELLGRQCEAFDCNKSFLISRDGQSCLIDAVVGCDIAVIATRGIVAIDAVMYCIANNIDIALANKEVLVTAGRLVMDALKGSNSKLLPVDSEHSAIWQCIGNSSNAISKIWLTASGGALYNLEGKQLARATADMALKHPNWSMGSKITIDSATMMNKALEVVEACWLFGVGIDDIEIVVHRQSIVHSMVQFADNSIIAQLSSPDMLLPIQYALLEGHRCDCNTTALDISKLNGMTFDSCDSNRFPCVRLASIMLDSSSPLMATVVNACNDSCVEHYLEGHIIFADIYNIIMHISNTLREHVGKLTLTIDNIKVVNGMAYATTNNYIMEKTC